MKHKVKVQVPVEKRGLFGIKKTVMETRTIEVDGKTYKKMKKECAGGSQMKVKLSDIIDAIEMTDQYSEYFLDFGKR